MICILLMSWLPFFMVAAHAMNMQMALENAQPVAAQTTEHTQMSCHEHDNHDKKADSDLSLSDSHDSNAQHANSQHSNSHHCSFCAFCVIGSAMAATPISKTAHLKTANIQPLFFDVAFSSQDYPPAIKPPILN